MGNMKKNNIAELMKEILKFRERRDWAQFHDPKNLAEAIAIESGELLEHFLWKTAAESRKITKEKREKLAAEIADILIFSMLFAHETGVDIEKAILDKIKHNETRYPVDKAKGSAKKYTELK
jgi:NTP pyrophosphatase (non-canonical NTP hydrolase)